MNNMTRKRGRYFNVTVVHADGRPTTTQLYANDMQPAVEWAYNRVQYFGAWRSDSVVAVYLYDTHEGRLSKFVVSNGAMHDATEEEAVA